MNITGECNNQTHDTSHSKKANKKGNKINFPGEKLTDRFKNSTFALLNYLLILYGWSHQPSKFIFKDLVSGEFKCITSRAVFLQKKKYSHSYLP